MAERRYFNRELSWLAFNRRVLEEAENPAHPLLERLRFLSISANNLDEFFMVRMAGLKGHLLLNIHHESPDGMTTAEQLEAIATDADALLGQQQRIWLELQEALAQKNIKVLSVRSVSAAAKKALEEYFVQNIFPVLTPQALDPSHPFPFMPNKGIGVIFKLNRMSDGTAIHELVLIPQSLPRLIRIPGKPAHYVTIETVLRLFCKTIFPGYRVRGMGAFRIIRDSDIELEEEAEDLVRYYRTALKERRRGRVIFLEHEVGISAALERYLQTQLNGDTALMTVKGNFVGMADLAKIVEEDRPALKFPSFSPRFPERIREYDGDCFAAIRAKDILVHHPYEAFDVVIAFLEQAARDPDVVAIKQTLYRAGKQSAIIRALIEAAEAGKSVTAVVEIKARFEEEQNLLWASALERAGVQVVYGFVEWKTHAKISMVVRREGNEHHSYCHFGTGNYHPITARIYTDLSFFTADPRLGRDAVKVFNYITGYVEPNALEMLSLAPLGLRPRLMELIDEEIAHAQAGRHGVIWAKMNALVDPAIIDKLYEASQAGVHIELIVRGICCLRPGVTGLSSNIRVKSVVGRFLEHSRIWCFGNGEDMPNDKAKIFISSADWMPRNLDRRVEYALPIENATVHDQILDQVMLANLLDNQQSWELTSSGAYKRVETQDEAFNLHTYFMTNPSLSGRGKALKGKSVPMLKMRKRSDSAA
jgi:polyphosphate kinase